MDYAERFFVVQKEGDHLELMGSQRPQGDTGLQAGLRNPLGFK